MHSTTTRSPVYHFVCCYHGQWARTVLTTAAENVPAPLKRATHVHSFRRHCYSSSLILAHGHSWPLMIFHRATPLTTGPCCVATLEQATVAACAWSVKVTRDACCLSTLQQYSTPAFSNTSGIFVCQFLWACGASAAHGICEMCCVSLDYVGARTALDVNAWYMSEA